MPLPISKLGARAYRAIEHGGGGGGANRANVVFYEPIVQRIRMLPNVQFYWHLWSGAFGDPSAHLAPTSLPATSTLAH